MLLPLQDLLIALGVGPRPPQLEGSTCPTHGGAQLAARGWRNPSLRSWYLAPAFWDSGASPAKPCTNGTSAVRGFDTESDFSDFDPLHRCGSPRKQHGELELLKEGDSRSTGHLARVGQGISSGGCGEPPPAATPTPRHPRGRPRSHSRDPVLPCSTWTHC